MSTQYIRYPATGGSSGVTSLNTLTGALTLAAGSGISITPSGSTLTIANTQAGGTVTSVALADSTGVFNITGSPVTTSGTLTLSSFKSQAQSAVLIGPSSGGPGVPSFRLLLASDVPTLNQNTTGTAANITATSNSTLVTLSSLSLPYSQVTGGPGGTVTSVGFSDASTTPIFNITGSPVTGSGTLTETLKTQSANMVFAGPTTGAAAQPTFRTLVSADLPSGVITGISVSTPLTSTGGSAPTLAINLASSGTNGYLQAVDFNTFNGKQNALSVAAPIILAANQLSLGGLPDSSLIYNLGLACSVASSALTVALKQQNGSSDPALAGALFVGFRDATSANGDFLTRTLTSASSIVVPSGATLGTTSGNQSYLYVYILDHTGTIEPAISSKVFDTGSVQSTTAISSGATSATVLYSTTARTNVAIRLVGRLSVSEATAGTWASAPTEVSLLTQTATPTSTKISRVQYNSSAQLAAPNTPASVDFDTTTFDSAGLWQAGGFNWVATIAGYYDVEAVVELDSLATGQAQVLLYVNASLYSALGNGPALIPNQIGGSDNIHLNIGDSVAIYVNQTSSSNVAIAPVEGHTLMPYFGT